jgi:hypothetical protein
MTELIDLFIRLIVLTEGCEITRDSSSSDLLSVLGTKAVARYGEQERESQVRLLPDVLPADALFGNEGRFLAWRAEETDAAAHLILAALVRIFLSFAEELASLVASTLSLLHSGCLILICHGDWAVKADCLNILRVWREQKLAVSTTRQLLLEVNISVQVFEATLLPDMLNDPEDAADIALMQDAFFGLLHRFCSYPVDGLELRSLRVASSQLAGRYLSGDLDSLLKHEHQVSLCRILVAMQNLPDQQPDVLLKRCIRLRLTAEVDQLVWQEAAAALHKEPSRPGKRKAEGEPIDGVLDLTECKMWVACSDAYFQLMKDNPLNGEHLRDLLTVATNLGSRILLKWPNSLFVIFDAAALAFLTSVIESLVSSGNQLILLTIVRDLTLLLHASPADQSPELWALLVGIASRPWLRSGLKRADLRLDRWQEVLTAVQEEEESLVRESLYILSLFKKECCPKWRLAVMKHCRSSHGELIVG